MSITVVLPKNEYSVSLGAALLFPVAEDQERDTSEEVSP